ncbi:hypothetical protein Mapa_018678 [Marchantia paleacea]|nr:hypothetical protein Mapa_018678 [Marchantia paleacea]
MKMHRGNLSQTKKGSRLTECRTLKYTMAQNYFICAVLLLLTLAAEVHTQDQDFNYLYGDPKGIGKWGGSCSTGKRQSPINIRACRFGSRCISVDNSLAFPLNTSYVSTDAKLQNGGYGPELEGDFGKLFTGDKAYDAKKVLFHRPAEHSINGVRYDLEMQIIHKSAQGETAVIAVLYQLGLDGSVFFSEFFNLLPQIAQKGSTPVTIKNLKLDTPSGQYARYAGSLTTPPCSEQVTWTVLIKQLPINFNQLFSQYRESFSKSNSRPVQNLNDRTVTKSKEA